MEKYIEDARQDEKDVLDVLEAIMRPTDHVKEELTARKPVCKKHTFSILLRRPRPWPGPGPPAQGQAPAKKDGKFKLAA